MSQHLPVLLTETLDLLQPERGGVFIDATLGLGGHAEGLLQRAQAAGKKVRLIGIDQDPEALALAEKRLGASVEYMPGNFADLWRLQSKKIVTEADGILLDIGVSSYQLDTPERGFSFQENGPLDMRMDPGGTVTAASIVNTWPEFKLANLFYNYGEERLSRKIAKAIVERRKEQPFTETLDLAHFVTSLYHPALRHKKPHPATRVFQALRIEVNRELEALQSGMEGALQLLAPQGVLAIISFHSLEDRLVKHRFRNAVETGDYELLTKKAVTASEEEAATNPRSRSAKLRAIRRLS